MDIIGGAVNGIERNPKVALGLIGGLVLVDVVCLSVSGIYVSQTKKAVNGLNKKIDDIGKSINEFITMADETDEDDEEE